MSTAIPAVFFPVSNFGGTSSSCFGKILYSSSTSQKLDAPPHPLIPLSSPQLFFFCFFFFPQFVVMSVAGKPLRKCPVRRTPPPTPFNPGFCFPVSRRVVDRHALTCFLGALAPSSSKLIFFSDFFFWGRFFFNAVHSLAFPPNLFFFFSCRRFFLFTRGCRTEQARRRFLGFFLSPPPRILQTFRLMCQHNQG